MSAWFERDPARLDREVAAWREHGFTLNQDAFRDGFVRFVGAVTYDHLSYGVRVDYPQGFPYQRPEVFLPDVTPTSEDRHRTLVDGLLCLRGYLPDEWDSEDLGVDLLPDLDTWLHGHFTGEWENEHRAADLSFLPRIGFRSILVGPEFQRRLDTPHGRLPAFEYVHGNNHVIHVTTSRPVFEGALQRSDDSIAYVRLQQAPLALGRLFRQSETGGLAPADVLTTLDHELAGTRATLEGYLRVHRRWREGTIVCLQFPLPGEDEPRWVWEALVLHPQRGLLPVQVNYGSDLFNRVRNELDTATLKDARALILGQGSIGAPVAIDLARAGVGNLTLLDVDFIAIGNLTRHPASIRHLGMPKTLAVRDLILERIPGASITPGINGNPITNLYHHYDELRTLAADHDVVAVCVGNDNLHQYLNEILLQEHARAVYAWVYVDAAAGRVVRVLPDSTGCMRCLNLWIAENPERYGITPRIPKDINKLPLDYGCNTPAVPGSGFDTTRIALAQTRMVLQLLLGDQAAYPYDDADHRLLINRPLTAIPGSDFETSGSWKLEPHPECKVGHSAMKIERMFVQQFLAR
ncbi:MAG TPA: ThiF family adenylyltransferase [Thermoanaerobaculia bacterium]|nr:ThiF family adenylyltransferase [Thermoanaerobaculia bacterium]